MKFVDRFLQRWRIRKVIGFIPENAWVVDIGAFHGELFQSLGTSLAKGFGVEPLLGKTLESERYGIHPGFFPDTRPNDSGTWDAITMLAVLEHIPEKQQAALAANCLDLLRPGGRVIVTVPSKAVDAILEVLKWFHLIDGMSLEEHYGFQPSNTPQIFAEPGFRLLLHKRFQLGLNHLFVFEKRPGGGV
ncbi:MAG: class I SAM-dependent methyltransferase [Puniceicoccales bacterium]|jgi:SAM-dependent methyltransferase|nr:class I SAM-dependent methyltransferase [Puniceicoccales bacterium]